MSKILSRFGGVAVALALGLSSADAITITPNATPMSDLPDVTFGGSGIPNSEVAANVIGTPLGSVILALTAHQRYENPPLTNDGVGTYTALTGGDVPDDPGYGRWNFGFYSDLAETSPYKLFLYYDTNGAAGNDVDTKVELPFGDAYRNNSWNLGMWFFDFEVFGFGNTNGVNYDPNLVGEYSFALVLTTADGQELGRTAMNVVTTASVPDGGTTAGLLLLGLFGLGLIKGRMNKLSPVAVKA